MSKNQDSATPLVARKIRPYYLVEERGFIKEEQSQQTDQLSSSNRALEKYPTEGSLPEISIEVKEGVNIRKTRFRHGQLSARKNAAKDFMIDLIRSANVSNCDYEVRLYLIRDGNETEKKLIRFFWFDTILQRSGTKSKSYSSSK